MSVTGGTANRLGFLLCGVLCTLPARIVPSFMSSHYLVFEDGPNETGSSVGFLCALPVPIHDLPFFYICWRRPSRVTPKVNPARAHNGLRLHR